MWRMLRFQDVRLVNFIRISTGISLKLWIYSTKLSHIINSPWFTDELICDELSCNELFWWRIVLWRIILVTNCPVANIVLVTNFPVRICLSGDELSCDELSWWRTVPWRNISAETSAE